MRDSADVSIVEITRYDAGGRVTTRTADTSATYADLIAATRADGTP